MAFKSFLDARQEEAGSIIEADLCIIGSGAAGITIAREFIGSSIRVCLLEAGGLSVDPEVDDRSVIDNIGREYRNKDWFAPVRRLYKSLGWAVRAAPAHRFRKA